MKNILSTKFFTLTNLMFNIAKMVNSKEFMWPRAFQYPRKIGTRQFYMTLKIEISCVLLLNRIKMGYLAVLTHKIKPALKVVKLRSKKRLVLLLHI